MATVQSGKWKTYYATDVEIIQGILYTGTSHVPGPVKVALFQGSSNANDLSAITTFADLTNEVPAGNGYAAGGVKVDLSRQPNTNPPGSWVAGMQADFDAGNPYLTASGGDIVFRYLVLYVDNDWSPPAFPSGPSVAKPVIAVALGDASNQDVTVPDGTPLQIAFNPGGSGTEERAILIGHGTGDVDS